MIWEEFEEIIVVVMTMVCCAAGEEEFKGFFFVSPAVFCGAKVRLEGMFVEVTEFGCFLEEVVIN